MANDWREKLKEFKSRVPTTKTTPSTSSLSDNAPVDIAPSEGQSFKVEAARMGVRDVAKVKRNASHNLRQTKRAAIDSHPTVKERQPHSRKSALQNKANFISQTTVKRNPHEELKRQLQNIHTAYNSGKPATVAPGEHESVERERKYDELLDCVLTSGALLSLKTLSAAHSQSRSALYHKEGWLESVLGAAGRRHQLAIGIDLGTAWTKVCVSANRDAWVVPWFPLNRSISKYLLPGILSINDADICHLGELSTPSAYYENLKLPLLRGEATLEEQARLVSFLALVMRYTRHWMLNENIALLKNNRIEWVANVGYPTESWNNAGLMLRFRSLVRLAWRLSLDPDVINMARVHAEVSALDSTLLESDFPNIQTVPEFAGQVASYVRSPYRRPDLHLMVDVGAGTLDITSFNVHEDYDTAENIYPIFQPKVANLGTHFLAANRVSGSGVAEITSDIDRVPTIAEVAAETQISTHELQQRDDAVRRRVASEIRRVLRLTKQRWYPLSPRWAEGVPVFFCGGGATVPAYENGLRDAGFKIQAVIMGKPSNLIAPELEDRDFTRVSPAYGLAQSFENLGKCRPSAEVGELYALDSHTMRASAEFVSKDNM